MGNAYDVKMGQWRANASTLLSAQEFWFAFFMTVLYVAFLEYMYSTYKSQRSHTMVYPSTGLG
jgi:hypothetical protein